MKRRSSITLLGGAAGLFVARIDAFESRFGGPISN
jgi:hypothetical protein